jgi:hypothetical protein
MKPHEQRKHDHRVTRRFRLRLSGDQSPDVNPEKRLRIYLNDHLAGSVAGCELAKRALAENRGNEYGRLLARIVGEIEEDQRALRDVMARLEVPVARPKVAAAWAAEKIGRLKLNGQLRGYSPLSRLLELEGLVVGVRGKLALWRSLEQLAAAEPRLAAMDFESLARRANDQQEELESHRLQAAADALHHSSG